MYLNIFLWFLWKIVSKWWIQKSSRLSWSFRSQWSIIWTEISLWAPLWFGQKKCSINFSCLNRRFPSPNNLEFDLRWLNRKRNFVTVDPTYCFLHLLHVCFVLFCCCCCCFFLQYNRLQLDKTKNKWKIFYEDIIKKETRKYSTNTYLTALSNRTVKKVGRGWTPEGKKMNIYI